MAMNTSAESLNDAMRKAVMPVTIFVGIEVVVAFFGNLVVLYIFLFRYGNSNFRYFVLCLSLIDITCALTTMPGEMVTQLYWYVYPVPMVCKIKSFFNVFTVSSEALCLLTIAVDRYRKICHPLGWQIRLNVARWLCVGMFTAGFAISLPVAIYWGTHTEKEENNITTTVCEKDQKYKDTNRPFEYSASIEAIISTCLVCMLLLYILIAKTVIFQHRVRKREEIEHMQGNGTFTVYINKDNNDPNSEIREQGPVGTVGTEMTTAHAQNRDSKEANTLERRAFNARVRRKTLIMFILTVTFTMTTVLYLTLLSFIAEGILRDLTDNQRAVYFFFFRLYFINHVINPFVFGILDPQFKKSMRSCRRYSDHRDS